MITIMYFMVVGLYVLIGILHYKLDRLEEKLDDWKDMR